MRHALAVVLLGTLAACHGNVKWTGSEDRGKDVHIAMDGSGNGDQVSVKIPGFDANVSLPNFDMGKHMDLDGIRLAPDTKVSGVDIVGHDKDGGDGDGRVQVRFTNPRAPAALVDYYRAQASGAGFDAVTATGDAMTATKRGKQFALTVSPQGGGSQGVISISGGN